MINHDNPYSDNVTLFQVKCFSGAWFLLNCCEVSPIWLSPIALFVATVVQIICFSLTLVHRLHNKLDNQNSLHCLNQHNYVWILDPAHIKINQSSSFVSKTHYKTVTLDPLLLKLQKTWRPSERYHHCLPSYLVSSITQLPTTYLFLIIHSLSTIAES